MKRFILTVLLFIMFLPFYVNAKTCDTDKISISSITTEETTGGAEEISAATASGKKINLNLSMSEVGDNIEYKIVVKNDSNEDYKLDKNSFNISSDYIDYTLESDDGSNIVKANSSKTIYIKVKYKNKVPAEAFETGTYTDNNVMRLVLSTKSSIFNPQTGNSLLLLVLIFIICIGISTYIVLRKKKFNKVMALLLTLVITIPTSVYALCNVEINIESKVTIRETREVTFYKQWSLYSTSYEYMMVPTNEFHKYLDLYETNYENYDSSHLNNIPDYSISKVKAKIIPKIVKINEGVKHKKSTNYNYWYKITYKVPKYDEKGKELHYIIKENHTYGLDVLGGDPGDDGQLGFMAFDPYEKNYNRSYITPDERELLISKYGYKDEDLGPTNEGLYYEDYFPMMVTPNEHYLYGIGENNTLFNYVACILDGVHLIS